MDTEEKKEVLKKKFKEMDKNGDGVLNFREFSDLMTAGGKKGLNERELHKLFNKVAGGDGKIEFSEFVDYCYEQEKSAAHQQSRTTGGRHERLAQSTMVSTDTDDPSLWTAVQTVYDSYLGNDCRFESRDFLKMCIDCNLFDTKFKKPDVDIIFSKYKVKGQNTIFFESLQQCIRAIALKKGVPTKQVQQIVAEKASAGPSKTGTTDAQYVRFYDDKSQYTGQHAHNENFGLAGSADMSPGSRHERIKQAQSFERNEEEEADWGALEDSFMAFCNGIDGVGDNLLDNREFKQLCEDCNLFVPGKFTVADGDIIFSKVKNKGERRIGFEQFKTACVGIARKRGCIVADVQAKISEVHGPKGRGVTKADSVRFHDDKSLYTGMHAY